MLVAEHEGEVRFSRRLLWVVSRHSAAARKQMPPQRTAIASVENRSGVLRAVPDRVATGPSAAAVPKRARIPSPVRERDRVRGATSPERPHPSPGRLTPTRPLPNGRGGAPPSGSSRANALAAPAAGPLSRAGEGQGEGRDLSERGAPDRRRVGDTTACSILKALIPHPNPLPHGRGGPSRRTGPGLPIFQPVATRSGVLRCRRCAPDDTLTVTSTAGLILGYQGAYLRSHPDSARRLVVSEEGSGAPAGSH
ncbi:hypothetical protein F6X53_16770 [Methylobacterium soli]|uniref:Uncharacterized protein n=1 Tax=Methylobacterium soli TaxID=553447 RepID=A0A6L3SVT7_9HYPH|nr:hypothetical protein F6X53_16770 [Methylobacterium soli]